MRRSIVAWALYDWGNSAFATSVLVGFFPLMLNRSWSAEATGAETTSRLMLANGAASLLLALAAPALGAIADRGGRRKTLLGVFALWGAGATAALFWIPNAWGALALVTFSAASFGFAAANVFYDSLLVDVAPEGSLDRVSAFGYGLGYAGGGLLLAAHAVLVLHPEALGLPDAETAMRFVFLTVAGWWITFTVPAMVWVRERRPGDRKRLRAAVSEGLAQLWRTLRRIARLRAVALFLAAYWLYIDGVNTVMKVAIDFGYKLGFGPRDLIVALLLVQLISFPAALAFGWLGERRGPKLGLLIGLGVYVVVTLWATFLSRVWEFYALGCAIGLVQGGVFSLSRSYFARLIPEGETGEFFGFYNLIGKLAAVLGPFLVAGAASVTGSTRTAVVAILPLLLLGGLLLAAVPKRDGRSQ